MGDLHLILTNILGLVFELASRCFTRLVQFNHSSLEFTKLGIYDHDVLAGGDGLFTLTIQHTITEGSGSDL